MKKHIFFIVLVALFSMTTICCTDFPVDEDGLLITERAECYVSSFELLSADFQTACVSRPTLDNGIDTTQCRIDVQVLFGTDLKNLYPQFSLATDAKLEPKITGKVDFSDLENPKQWTVISGNRKIRKTYTVYVTVQQMP